MSDVFFLLKHRNKVISWGFCGFRFLNFCVFSIFFLMRNLKIGSKKSILSQKWLDCKKTCCEKSNGASGDKNNFMTLHVLRKWTKRKNSVVLEFSFESNFSFFSNIFSTDSMHNCHLYFNKNLSRITILDFQKLSEITRGNEFLSHDSPKGRIQ